MGIDLPQCAQTVRSVGFASARHVLPLVGKERPPISSHHLQAARQASSGLGGRRESNRGRSQPVQQASVTSDPAPDQQRAAITPTQESSADVSAREPDTLVPYPAEQGWRCRPDDPDIRERHEIIGLVLEHGATPLSESAPSTRAEGLRLLAGGSRCGLQTGSQ